MERILNTKEVNQIIENAKKGIYPDIDTDFCNKNNLIKSASRPERELKIDLIQSRFESVKAFRGTIISQ